MSSHFTYEIDERKLRVRLKDLEETPADEAWASFEAFSQSKSGQHQGGKMADIQLPLNRNVIVPVIFGALIIVFSFILYNFINIKKTPENASQSPVKDIVIPPAQIRESQGPEPMPVSPAQNPAPGGDNAVKASQPTIVREENTAKPNSPQAPAGKATEANAATPAQNKQAGLTNTTAPAPSVSAPSPTVAAAPTATVARPEAGAKPKRNKRSEIVDNDSTPEARPAIGGDERDAGERPN